MNSGIRLLHIDDLQAYHSHLSRHSFENGRDGELIHAPYEAPRSVPFDEFEKASRSSWTREVTQSGWERCWGLFDQEGPVRGTLRLRHAPRLDSALHRATLELGIERTHRRKGWGFRFVETALDWARNQPSLAWIDLGVFAQNEPARALYSRFGFREVGRRQDFFRVRGVKITDIQMTLNLR